MCPTLRYQRAERALKSSSYLLNESGLQSKHSADVVKKTIKMSCLLDQKTIEQHTATSCSRGSQEHPCKILFRENPKLVKNWRILWASLPKQVRLNHLLQAMAKPGEFHFLGIKVCALAFQHLTGVSAGTLQLARENRDKGNQSFQSVRQLNTWMGTASNSKPSRYLVPQLLSEMQCCVHIRLLLDIQFDGAHVFP